MTRSQKTIDPDAPAFPTHEVELDGMNLRTWLAGLAMQGLLSNDVNGQEPYDLVSKMAVNHADDLIRELSKPKEP